MRARMRCSTLAALLVLFAAARTADAQITAPVDLGSNEASSSITPLNPSSIGITTTQTVPVGGSIIVIAVASTLGLGGPPPAAAVCSDSAGGHTYNTDVMQNDGVYALTTICSTHALASPLGAGSTITVTWSGGPSNLWERVHAFLVTGLASAPLDKTATASGQSASPSSGATATTTQANELVFGAFADIFQTVSQVTFTPGTNGTSNNCAATGTTTCSSLGGVGSSVATSLFGTYCVVSATGAYAAQATFSIATTRWDAVVATYQGNTAPATHFAVSAPASATAGSAFSFTVTALDATNNPTLYSGSVHFTSSDGQAVVPANSTLTLGTGTFSATLKTAGNQTITATDTVTASITGTSNNIPVSPAAATHFTVSAPATAIANSTFPFTVAALDQFNNTATGYGGTVHFTSSDGVATLPGNSTLTNGVGTFSATLRALGGQTITATDTLTASITGTSNTITIGVGAATHFTVSAPSSATAGSAFNFTVTALDPFNNTATGYGGTVHFNSSDGAATLPANSALTNGTGSFSATLKTAGNQTITATDTVTASITGTSNTMAVSAAAATHFLVSAPASATAGSASNFTVAAQDPFNNTATGYGGTVHFTSSDGQAVLPANSMLTNGTGTFSATLKTAGNQTITATDTVTASITGTSGAVAVSLAATDVAISKTASGPPYGTGLPITYTIVVSDVGPVSATGVTVTDAIPAGTTFVSATPTQGSCSGTTAVTCNVGTLASGASATIALVLTLPSTPGSVSNTATVTSSSPDTNAANNSSTATVSVVDAASIPTLSTIGLWMLALMMTLLGFMRLRR